MIVEFEYPSPTGGTFRDAIYLLDDHGLSDEELTAMKEARFAQWCAALQPTEEGS